MGSWLSEREQRLVAGAETASAATPIPTQIVSNGEYLPPPQSETQKRVERRIFELADENGKRLGLSRRQFMQTGCGMAAAFLAMNEVYGGGVFQVDTAEAREPELTRARAQGLAGQFIFDVQTHFVRDDFDKKELLDLRQVRRRPLEPGAEGRYLLARPLQVPELRQGSLLRQRYQHRAALRRALRRSELVAPVQRADRQGARRDQRFRGLAAAARAYRDHAQAGRVDGGGRQGDRGLQAGFVEGLHHRRPARAIQVSVAPGRRAGDVSLLRQGR